MFAKSAFRYEAEADRYICPAGQLLNRGARTQSKGKAVVHYFNRAACPQCALKGQCTTSSHRVICRRVNEWVVERVAQKVREHPEKVARRREVVEHVFGTLRLWGHDCFLLRGLEKVRAEFSLSALAYNLRRVLNLLSIEELLASLRSKVGCGA